MLWLCTDFCLCLVNLTHCQHWRNCLLLAESHCQGGLALLLRHIPLHLFFPETEGWLPRFRSKQCNRASRIDTTSKLEVSWAPHWPCFIGPELALNRWKVRRSNWSCTFSFDRLHNSSFSDPPFQHVFSLIFFVREGREGKWVSGECMCVQISMLMQTHTRARGGCPVSLLLSALFPWDRT